MWSGCPRFHRNSNGNENHWDWTLAHKLFGNAAKQQYGFSKADVFIKGVGLGRDAAVRTLASLDIAVESIHDVTGVPHGGVRPKKARRV